jgi:hypothetical protein
VVIAVACGLLASAGPAGGQSAPRAKASILFALDADGGTATGQKGARFDLRLRGVDGDVVWITDRPARDTGLMPVRRMLKLLRESARGAPPNVILEVDGGTRGPSAMAVVLRNVRYSAKSSVLRADARRLGTIGGRRLRHYRGRLVDSLPRRFGTTSVFIDSAPFGSTNFCKTRVQNYTEQPVTLTDQFKWSTDTWDPAPPGNGYVLDLGAVAGWQSDGGFARGCGNSTTWTQQDGTTFHTSLTDPYGDDPNSISCTSSDPAGHPCHIDTGSTTRGPSIDVLFYFCDFRRQQVCPGQ